MFNLKPRNSMELCGMLNFLHPPYGMRRTAQREATLKQKTPNGVWGFFVMPGYSAA